jgi:hypothetical protein
VRVLSVSICSCSMQSLGQKSHSCFVSKGIYSTVLSLGRVKIYNMYNQSITARIFNLKQCLCRRKKKFEQSKILQISCWYCNKGVTTGQLCREIMTRDGCRWAELGTCPLICIQSSSYLLFLSLCTYYSCYFPVSIFVSSAIFSVSQYKAKLFPSCLYLCIKCNFYSPVSSCANITFLSLYLSQVQRLLSCLCICAKCNCYFPVSVSFLSATVTFLSLYLCQMQLFFSCLCICIKCNCLLSCLYICIKRNC